MTTRILTGTLVLALLAATAPGAQVEEPAATFEVASVRRGDSLAGGGTMGVRPGGQFMSRNILLRNLIAEAYDVPVNRVLEGPGWIGEERYDIEARAEGEMTWDRARPMLLALLRERFNLAAHKETRELPVYALVLARPDGRLGPRLRRNDVDCLNPEARATALSAAPPGAVICEIRFATGRLIGGPRSIDSLAGSLTGASGRPVLNRTGLEGQYDMDLEWAATPQAEGLSIFTAVQEQLGLKLESDNAPLEVLIIERVERPTEN